MDNATGSQVHHRQRSPIGIQVSTAVRAGLQFAVVREDPEVELAVLDRHRCQRLLLVASGGCTALTLRLARPASRITLVDPNPAQFRHLDRKLAAFDTLDGDARKRAFNVGTTDPDGLSECGNFEALFRGLRVFIHEFVRPHDAWMCFFDGDRDGHDLIEQAFASPYWPVAFKLYLADGLLDTMFGTDATQHAEPGSYPSYFQSLIERGLRRADARDNPFLQHILLGQYRDRSACRPCFLRDHSARIDGTRFDRVLGRIDEVADIGEHDFVDLSNIFDWSAAEQVARTCRRLASALRPGAVVLWRQLNNTRDVGANFGSSFAFDREFGRRLQAEDRSLFYSSIHVGVRR